MLVLIPGGNKSLTVRRFPSLKKLEGASIYRQDNGNLFARGARGALYCTIVNRHPSFSGYRATFDGSSGKGLAILRGFLAMGIPELANDKKLIAALAKADAKRVQRYQLAKAAEDLLCGAKNLGVVLPPAVRRKAQRAIRVYEGRKKHL